MPFLPFIGASIAGRGARFFLVAILLAWGGERLESMLRTYMDRIGWGVVVLTVIGVIVYKFV